MSVPLVPAATVAIVDQGGRMRPHFQAFADGLATVRSADAVDGTFIIDRIPASRSLIKVEFDLVPATDGVSLYLLARTGSGVEVTAYSWSLPFNDSGTTMASVSDTSDPQAIIAGTVQNDGLVGGCSGRFTIHNIQSSRYKRVSGDVTNFDGTRERWSGISGRIDTALPITGLELRFSSGLIASGYARVDTP